MGNWKIFPYRFTFPARKWETCGGCRNDTSGKVQDAQIMIQKGTAGLMIQQICWKCQPEFIRQGWVYPGNKNQMVNK